MTIRPDNYASKAEYFEAEYKNAIKFAQLHERSGNHEAAKEWRKSADYYKHLFKAHERIDHKENIL